ncbi:hypothetical protein BK816_07705 [Boudabousia tangfeifanii]|uniref:Serine aminopeptidase S33 domain-containing protein n=1 Tax=Boudabousia tangfeifanii TaxID=1912795 RepID=A0A1D9MLL5_9ACTO|nr:hypothetical protein BK816_07705 [Boudabousia tangfeifanii]
MKIDLTADLAAAKDGYEPDILGPGFVARTLELQDDDEGPVVATLVRYDPKADPEAIEPDGPVPTFNLLYVHGWNDYFFQKELARNCATMGARFYAIDLRKYGRSLREGQTFGYVDTLDTYDEDLHAAINAIQAGDLAEVGRVRPLVLMGHSTGGLTAALWADRHPGSLAGLILNSPWLELQTAASMRGVSQPFVERLAARSPFRELPLGGGPNFYGMSLAGWQESDGPLPPELEAWPDDPANTGWNTNPEWKKPGGAPTRAGWFNAILTGHAKVAAGLDIHCPVFVGISIESASGSEWHPIMRRQDTVLDVSVIALRALNLSRSVTLNRYDGKHDLALSDPDVRPEYYADLHHWLGAFVRAEDGSRLATPGRKEYPLCP